MAIRGYVLIEADAGKAKVVADSIAALSRSDRKVVSVDAATGTFDVIVHVESAGLDELGVFIGDAIQRIVGVQRTNTCLAIRSG